MYRLLFVIAIITLQATYTASTSRLPGERYPRSPIQDASANDVPDECKGQNYCTIKPANYPQAEFNAMFKGSRALPPPSLVSQVFGDRNGDPDYRDDCNTKITFEPLYKVRSEDGKWHTVIQSPEETYIQRIRLETCEKEGSACFTGIPLGPGVTTYCKQNYSVWEFLVSDGKNGTERIKAELPICCTCHYNINKSQ